MTILQMSVFQCKIVDFYIIYDQRTHSIIKTVIMNTDVLLKNACYSQIYSRHLAHGHVVELS